MKQDPLVYPPPEIVRLFRALRGAPMSVVSALRMDPCASVEDLAQATGYSVRRVKQALKELEIMGYCRQRLPDLSLSAGGPQ